MVARLARLGRVSGCTARSPLRPPSISGDRHIGFVVVQFNDAAEDLPGEPLGERP